MVREVGSLLWVPRGKVNDFKIFYLVSKIMRRCQLPTSSRDPILGYLRVRSRDNILFQRVLQELTLFSRHDPQRVKPALKVSRALGP
jgi:hypothetical protein